MPKNAGDKEQRLLHINCICRRTIVKIFALYLKWDFQSIKCTCETRETDNFNRKQLYIFWESQTRNHRYGIGLTNKL